MRFVNYHEGGGSSSLFIDEQDKPKPGPEEVLVKVYAFGVNRADLLQRKGHYPPPKGASEILGLECSGVVHAVGENAQKWNEGDEVCGLVDGGAYSEYCVMDGGMIWQKPAVLSWTEVAAMPEAFLTAYQALFQLMDVNHMDSVLIHAAASGVGSAAIQLLQDLDVKKWGTASGGKISFCLKHGYDAIINYKNESFLDKIQEWTGANGVDGIVDFVGGNYFQDNLKSLAKDGSLIMLATLGGIHTGEVNLLPVISRRLTIKGSTLRSRDRAYKRDLVTNFLGKFSQKINQGKIRPIIYQTYDWGDIGQAHALMEENKNAGKIVVLVS